ncbi:MAG: hypothetical protein E3J81_07025 [Dehalococcoidia bacterium]|nr:MAG: hypothetical protein E3J81_07025 [Dehalococcoidia bacterium]
MWLAGIFPEKVAHTTPMGVGAAIFGVTVGRALQGAIGAHGESCYPRRKRSGGEGAVISRSENWRRLCPS